MIFAHGVQILLYNNEIKLHIKHQSILILDKKLYLVREHDMNTIWMNIPTESCYLYICLILTMKRKSYFEMF